MKNRFWKDPKINDVFKISLPNGCIPGIKRGPRQLRAFKARKLGH